MRAVSRMTFLAACAAATILVAVAYANSIDNSFHFDDSHVIESNAYLRSLHNVPLFFKDAHTFSSLPQNSTYRPLVTLSLALDYARGHGLAPRQFHVTQIALLLITGALLVVFFIPIIGEWPALFAATLFCLHTANTETMNLISARSELISTIGLLASFILYQRSPIARRTLLYLVPLAIGALAKAPLVVFAPLLLVYALAIERRSWRDALQLSLPSLILGIVLLVFLNSMNAPEWQSGGGSRYHYLITQPFIWLHYFRLFFLPIGLTADTDWTTFDHWYDTRAIAGDLFIAFLIVWLVRSFRREETRAVTFGIAWFAIALIPTSIFPLAEVANEHRIFFAYIGLVLAVVVWIESRAETMPRGWLIGAALSVVIVHAIGTHQRNETWRSEASLWADVVAKSPANGRAWMNFGLTQMGKGDYRGAKASFDRASSTVPYYSVLHINYGIVEGELGDEVAAEREFRRALELNPDASSHFFFARWLVGQGRGPESLPHLRQALRMSPAFEAARTLLLRVDVAIADPETAKLTEETRQIDPGGVPAGYHSVDAALKGCAIAMDRKDWVSAAIACRDALRHDPQSAIAFNNLGLCLEKLSFREESARAYESARAAETPRS